MEYEERKVKKKIGGPKRYRDGKGKREDATFSLFMTS